MDVRSLGQQLAQRHGSGGSGIDQVRSLLNYAECPYDGDWTLRSALMRLAQPHPARVGRVLDQTRRLDGPLHHVQRILERYPVDADRALTPETVAEAPVDPVPDIRTADLARLAAAGCDLHPLLDGYDSVAPEPLAHEERRAVPLLMVAVQIEALARTLAAWAVAGPADPPIDAVDQFLASVSATLDDLGVPADTWSPEMRRPRGRG